MGEIAAKMGRTFKSLPKEIAHEIAFEVANGTDVERVYVKRLTRLSTEAAFRDEFHMLEQSVPSFFCKLFTGIDQTYSVMKDTVGDKVAIWFLSDIYEKIDYVRNGPSVDFNLMFDNAMAAEAKAEAANAVKANAAQAVKANAAKAEAAERVFGDPELRQLIFSFVK